MPRRARATSLLIVLFAGAWALAGGLSWPATLPAAFAQDVDAGTGAAPPSADWQRLAAPLPYRPAEDDSGWLTRDDLARAVDVIADLGLFFAKLAEGDPDSETPEVREAWRQAATAYAAAAEDLTAAQDEGRFRIVVAEGSSLAIARRGEEIWVDSDLAGAWNVERIRRARQEGDDWPDMAALSVLLFDLWRSNGAAASQTWLTQRLDGLAIAQDAFEAAGPGAATVLARYGFLKDLYFKASLLRAATADWSTAGLWRDRTVRVERQIDTLLRSVATTGLGGDLPATLRDDWAAYGTQIVEQATERSRLVPASPQPNDVLARIGPVPQKPSREEAGPEIAETEIPDEDAVLEEDAPDADEIARLLAQASKATRTAEEAERRAQRLTRQAELAFQAAEDARAEQATLETELAAAETAAARQIAELTSQLDQASQDRAALETQLADAEDRAGTAETATQDGLRTAATREDELRRQLDSQATALAEADATVAQLEGEIERLQAAQTAATETAAETAARIAELEAELADAQAALEAERAEAQSAVQSNSETLAQSQSRVAELDAALASAQAKSQAETARADRAEDAAAEARQEAEASLAERDEELARLRDQIAALQAARPSAAGETIHAPAGTDRMSWLAPVLAIGLLAGALALLFVMSRRRGTARQTESAAAPLEPKAPPADKAVTVAPAQVEPKSRPSQPPDAVGHAQAPITSATIVEAVRRRDWGTANAQFAELSGATTPRLKQLLDDPSGELLALACRAADLDRLTFAALYLLQGQGRSIGDPEVVAGAVGLFERTSQAEAQRRLTEYRERLALSA